MITRVGEIWDNRQGYIDELFVRRYVRVFRVLTDDPTDGTQEVQQAAGLPQLYDVWTDGSQIDLGARCKSIQPQQDQDDPRAWKVVCEYTSESPSGTNRDPALWIAARGDPTQAPPEVRIEYETYRKILTIDYSNEGPGGGGKPLNNSAGFPFDPPVEVDAHRLVLQIDWNSSSFDAVGALQVIDCTNVDVWMGFPQYSLKIRKYGGQVMFGNGVTYWRRSAEIELRPELFLAGILDKGFQVLTGGNPKQNLDVNAQPLSTAIPLNGSGAALAANANPVYLTFLIARPISFGGLDIPNISDLVDGSDL